MGPARKPSATLKKRGGQRVCDDEVMVPAKKRAQSPLFSDSDSDEDAADMPTPRPSLLSRIRVAKSDGEKQKTSPDLGNDDEQAAKRQVQPDSDKDAAVTPDAPSSFLRRWTLTADGCMLTA